MTGGASPELLAALRAASRPSRERYLLGVKVASERSSIGSALAAEGEVISFASAGAALERLSEESFDLAILDEEDPQVRYDVYAAAREIRPFTDIVPVLGSDPARVGELFSQDAPAVLVRPFPPSDALLRAHVRYLASCRRARSRALSLRYAVDRHRAELLVHEPALVAALTAVLEEEKRAPSVQIVGRPEILSFVGGTSKDGTPDVVVVELRPDERVEIRLREARGKVPGAVFVLVDAAPTAARAIAAIYGGVRSYLPIQMLDPLGRIVANTCSRRRAEVTGRQLVETLTRFGVMEDPNPLAVPIIQDLDAKLIAASTSSSTSAIVPSSQEVLVVDDEVVVLTVLREILKRSGYRVTTSASAEEAMHLMKARVFDLVLTDKNLPGASGLEVLRLARSLDPPPAVVLITGYSSYDSATIALDTGAQDYIEKPIRDVESLLFRIRRAMARRNEQLERARHAHEKNDPSRRILIVELEGTRRKLLAEFLGQNYEVTAVSSGQEALDLLQGKRFDLVLADRNLPGMSGRRVIEQAQQLLPHSATVLYTAYPSYDTVKEAFELGVDAYLVRPSEDLKALGEKVAGALQSRGGILLG